VTGVAKRLAWISSSYQGLKFGIAPKVNCVLGPCGA
jgi:hypothetical protein